MNNFDEMIEKYSRELAEAKSKSMLEAIEEVLPKENEDEKEKDALDKEVSKDFQESADPTGEKNENEKVDSEIKREPEPIFENNAQNAENEAFGLLKIQVSAADGAYPIVAAAVNVRGTDGEKLYYTGFTNSDGIVDNIVLPAPKKEMSEEPSKLKPYAQYDITVKHPRFFPRKYIGVPVFASIKSIQTVELVPMSQSEIESETVTESEPNGLLLEY